MIAAIYTSNQFSPKLVASLKKRRYVSGFKPPYIPTPISTKGELSIIFFCPIKLYSGGHLVPAQAKLILSMSYHTQPN